jgi:hypothetical protein
MISPVLEYLIARLDDLDALHLEDETAFITDNELRAMVREVLSHLGTILSVNEILGRHYRHELLDLDSLASGIESLRAQLGRPRQPLPALQIDPAEAMRKLEEILGELRQMQGNPQAALKRSMRVSRMDWAFMRAAIYLIAHHESPQALRDQVLEKVQGLTAPDVTLLWSRIREELCGENGLAEGDVGLGAYE